MKKSILAAAIIACAVSAPMAFGAELKVKKLSPAQDATQETVLIGRAAADNMTVTLELEAAKSMWMQMGKSTKWTEHPVPKGELFHVEVKPVDTGSNTRIPYADVKFNAVNLDTKKKVSLKLHPMWGGSGLHYAYNSALAGDGAYEATVTVGAPSFGRDAKSKDMWTKPVTAKFHFKLADGKLVEVTEPAPESEPK
jgi:uncharacterized protein involved in high-affinity Fe2+ transport